MNQRKFGRTGLSVSELCLGAMQFGWLTNSETSHGILDAYRAAGGNFIQTSTCGPADAGPGLCRSEEIVGSWLQANPRARTDLVLSTRMRFARPVPGFRSGLADSIRRQCEESLRRLHTSHLDLLVIEWSDALLPMDEVLGSIDDLVRAGKLRHVGASGFPVWRFMESLGRSARRGGCRLESFQADYSLLERAPFEPDAIELAREYRVALLAIPIALSFYAVVIARCAKRAVAIHLDCFVASLLAMTVYFHRAIGICGAPRPTRENRAPRAARRTRVRTGNGSRVR
jgi:aryl-alcohol dehydrogenase-like predicted oxidoreductase